MPVIEWYMTEKVKEVKVTQLCLTLCNPMDWNPPDSVPGILQPRILEWVAITLPRGEGDYIQKRGLSLDTEKGK